MMGAAMVAALAAQADVKIGVGTKWPFFKEEPLYLKVQSKSVCKVLVDDKLQGWMDGGTEPRCFKLVSGLGQRCVKVAAADPKAEITVDFVPSPAGLRMADALYSDVPARCTEGSRWLYRIPAGKRLTFKLDGRFRGFPTAGVFCEKAGRMLVRWGDRQVEVVGTKTGYLPFDAVALGETDAIEFIVEEGEFHLIGVGFTMITFPPTVAEMQALCQSLCDRAVAEGLQGGVQFCAYRDGQKIVDVYAGHLTTNADSAAVTSDTLFPIFSTEKPLLATACHRAVERGLMDYDKPLCTWWPELTGDGKEKLTLRETLGYRTCLPGAAPGGKGNPVMGRPLTDRELCDWDLVCRTAAADKPHGIPGTTQAYLPYAYAWMIGHPLEVAMKKPLKQVLDEEVLVPVGIEKEFYFVVPREEYPRVANFCYGQFCENMNEDWARQAILPSAWAVSSARALGKFYNRLCGFDGQAPLIKKETLDAALKPCRHPSDPLPSAESMKRDWFMLFGMGYGLWGEADRMDRVFGHGGAGGSEALVDRDKKLIVAFTCNFCKNCNPLRDRLYEVVGLRWRYWNGGVNIQDLQMTTSSGGSFGAGITSH